MSCENRLPMQAQDLSAYLPNPNHPPKRVLGACRMLRHYMSCENRIPVQVKELSSEFANPSQDRPKKVLRG